MKIDPYVYLFAQAQKHSFAPRAANTSLYTKLCANIILFNTKVENHTVAVIAKWNSVLGPHFARIGQQYTVRSGTIMIPALKVHSTLQTKKIYMQDLTRSIFNVILIRDTYISL
ncbi:hypothetical protein AHF37_11195 [Paragonimus kellicotti]|nr:hypothetical protein AHF37_11195 [Paragonimus kellicotti]